MAKKRVKKLTEEDVLLAWRWLVEEEARKPRARTEYEDRLQTAWLGLLYAVRTWTREMRPFKEFARDCIRAYLVYMQRTDRMETRAESGLSLDMTVKADGETTYGEMMGYDEQRFDAVLASLRHPISVALDNVRHLRERQGMFAFMDERLLCGSEKGVSAKSGYPNSTALFRYVDLHGVYNARMEAAKEQADELWNEIRFALAHLTEDERNVLDAYYNRGMDWLDAAFRLGLSPQAACDIGTKGLRKLEELNWRYEA